MNEVRRQVGEAAQPTLASSVPELTDRLAALRNRVPKLISGAAVSDERLRRQASELARATTDADRRGETIATLRAAIVGAEERLGSARAKLAELARGEPS